MINITIKQLNYLQLGIYLIKYRAVAAQSKSESNVVGVYVCALYPDDFDELKCLKFKITSQSIIFLNKNKKTT